MEEGLFCYSYTAHRLKSQGLPRELNTVGIVISRRPFSTNYKLGVAFSVVTTELRLMPFYRAMHFSAKRGIAIACRLSVRLSVRPSVRL